MVENHKKNLSNMSIKIQQKIQEEAKKEGSFKTQNKANGITLIALVITIIVLLILAGVTIASLSGQNGILGNASKAKKASEKGDAVDNIKLLLSEWQIEKYTGTKGIEDFLEEKFESVIDNGDETYTVTLSGYEAVVDKDGNIVGEIAKAGPKPVVDEASIKITKDGATVEDNSQTSGTALQIEFTASIEGGTITAVTPGTVTDGKITYTTNGTEKEITFTITGTVNGEERTSTKKISVANKYKIDHSEVIVPTITATGNFANNSYIKEVREGEIPIPAGFTYVKGDKQGGAVITDSVDSNGNSNGSEFVWVPVLDVTKMYGTLADGTKAGKIYDWNNLDSDGNPANLNWTESEVTKDSKTVKEMSIRATNEDGSYSGYREPDTVSSCDGNADYLKIIKGILTNEQSNYASITAFKATMQRDFNSMIESVGRYGGFYIARYEMSLNSTTNKAEFIKGAKSTNAGNSNSYRWHGLYARAKEYSTSSTQGSMVWGCQYDAMLKWMQTNSVDVTSPTPVPRADRNQNRTTGTKEEDKILNIYDILGNSYEWTLEAYNSYDRANRGGYYDDSYSPRYRYYYRANYGNGCYSTRSALYIRWH